jgi:GntR family transcriptional regulator
MLLHISADGLPIYQQIVDQIQFRIFSGQLSAGDELPTIRGLAEELTVNQNTVARAYRDLEGEGLIEKRRTTGTFVAEISESRTAAQRQKLLAPFIDKLLIQARQLGFDADQVVEQLHKRDQAIGRTSKKAAEVVK